MNVELQRPQIDLEAIAAAYNYSPFPEGYVPPEKVDLGINWKDHEREISHVLLEAANLFEEAITSPLPDAIHISAKTLGSIEISEPSNQFIIEKRYDEEIKLLLLGPDGEDVAEFRAQQNANTWNIVHRMVNPAYRGQGIASNMLKCLETFIVKYGRVSDQDQSLEIEASQLDVLKYFSKKGFVVSAGDEARFCDILSRLESGDPTLVVASNPQDFMPEGRGHHKWYVFEKAYYDQMDRSNWTYEDYMKKSVRFKLEKKIEPKVIDSTVAFVVEAVTKTL